jgi:hypothetical protein
MPKWEDRFKELPEYQEACEDEEVADMQDDRGTD